MKERLDPKRRAAPQESRDEADMPFGHLVRKLHLEAISERQRNKSKDA